MSARRCPRADLVVRVAARRRRRLQVGARCGQASIRTAPSRDLLAREPAPARRGAAPEAHGRRPRRLRNTAPCGGGCHADRARAVHEQAAQQKLDAAIAVLDLLAYPSVPAPAPAPAPAATALAAPPRLVTLRRGPPRRARQQWRVDPAAARGTLGCGRLLPSRASRSSAPSRVRAAAVGFLDQCIVQAAVGPGETSGRGGRAWVRRGLRLWLQPLQRRPRGLTRSCRPKLRLPLRPWPLMPTPEAPCPHLRACRL